MHEGTPIIIKKKKSHGGHAHHGGSWKVAYADFVTAMMAFFMVMWIMGLSEDTRTVIAGYFNDPMGFMKNPPISKSVITLPGQQAPKPGNTRSTATEPFKTEDKERKLQNEIKKALEGEVELKVLLENMEMSLTQEGLRIEFVESAGAVFFESGQATIRPQAMKLIQRVAPILAQSGRIMSLEGHTDAVPYPSKSYDNWDLSWDRANSFRHALMENGVKPRQIRDVRALADTKLKQPDRPAAFSNRRVTLLLPFETDADSINELLPKDAFEHENQGHFAAPLQIAPPVPDVTVKTSSSKRH